MYASYFLCLRLTFVDCSTLVTDGVDIVGNWGLGCIIDIGWRALLLLVYIGTLELAGTPVFIGVTVALDFLPFIVRSEI